MNRPGIWEATWENSLPCLLFIAKKDIFWGVIRSWGLGRQPVGKCLLWTYEDLELGDSWVEECLPGTCKTPGSVPPRHTQTNTNKVDLQDSSILLNLNLRVFTYTHADFFRDSHHHLFLPFDNLRQGHKLVQSHCNTAVSQAKSPPASVQLCCLQKTLASQKTCPHRRGWAKSWDLHWSIQPLLSTSSSNSAPTAAGLEVSGRG